MEVNALGVPRRSRKGEHTGAPRRWASPSDGRAARSRVGIRAPTRECDHTSVLREPRGRSGIPRRTRTNMRSATTPRGDSQSAARCRVRPLPRPELSDPQLRRSADVRAVRAQSGRTCSREGRAS